MEEWLNAYGDKEWIKTSAVAILVSHTQVLAAPKKLSDTQMLVGLGSIICTEELEELSEGFIPSLVQYCIQEKQ
jgi:hypothetical protein